MITRLRLRASSLFAQWLLLAVALLILGSVIGLTLYVEHKAIDAGERDRLATQAKVIDENLGRQLLATNNALESLRADLTFFAAHKDGKALFNQRLQAIVSAMPGLRTIVIMNAGGVAVASNRNELIGQDFHELQRFQTIRRGGKPGTLFVSPPFKTPLGTWAIGLGKSVLGDRGEFAGAILTILDPVYFRMLLDSVRYAPDMWTSLAHADGKLFVMLPERPGIEGINLDQPGSFRNRHLASGLKATVMTGMVYATREERMMAQRIIQPADVPMDTALAVAVSRDLASIFAVWRRDAYVRGGLFAALTLIAALGLYFYQRRKQAYGRLAADREAERKQSEATLSESERYNRVLFESSPVGLALCRMDGALVDVNPAYAAILGRSVEQTLNLSYWDITPKKYAEQEQGRLRELRNIGHYGPYDKEYIHADGHLVPVCLNGLIVECAGEQFICSSVEDITQRKQDEQKKRAQLDELLRWQELMVGREERMLQLKMEVNALRARLGEPGRYPGEADS